MLPWLHNNVINPFPRYFNVKKYGAMGDGETDDTAAIQAAIDAAYAKGGGIVYCPDDTYLVSSSAEYVPALTLKDNVKLLLSSGATIQMDANAYEETSVVGIIGKSNVTVFGFGTIRGDKDTHTGETGEYGHGIQVAGSNNVTVLHVTIENCWGDGIFIGGAWEGQTYSQNVLINGFIISDCRRNGISIVSAKQLSITSGSISGTSGTLPQSGIDLEPYANTQFLVDVVINSISLNDNDGYGLLFGLGYMQNSSNESDITVSNITGSGNGSGLISGYTGFITYNMDISVDLGITPETGVTNLIDSVTTWTESYGCALSTDGNTLVLTGDGESAGPLVYYEGTGISGHKYFCYVEVQVTNEYADRINFYVYNGSDSLEVEPCPSEGIIADQWYTLSGVITYSGEGDVHFDVRTWYDDAATANGKVTKIRNAMMVDITAAFGAGNEPSSGECNGYYPEYVSAA